MSYLRLKGIALGGLVGLFSIFAFLTSFSTTSSLPTPHDRTIVSDAPVSVAPLLISEPLPMPTCRYRYINFSQDSDYPIPHWVYSLPESADRALVLAIALNESRFKPHARSERGAVGLMQLMPDTATSMAENVELASSTRDISGYVPRNPFDFRDPYVSLAVGDRYIRYLQAKPFIGRNIAYTLAAYNAGPANLQKWRRSFGRLPMRQFIDRIPYRETREYVQKVMRDYVHYKAALPEMKKVVWVERDKC
jgi:hypothetical protein